MMRWLLVVVLILLAGVGGFVYMERMGSGGRQVEDPLVTVLREQVYLGRSFSEGVVYKDPEMSFYTAVGVIDGRLYEEPFQLNKSNGELWGTNVIAYQLIYLDSKNNPRSVSVPLVVIDSGGEVLVLDDWGQLQIADEFGEEADLEQARAFFRKFIENKRGKQVSVLFSAFRGDIEELFLQMAQQGHPVQEDSFFARRFEYVKEYLVGKEARYDEFIRSGMGLDYLILDRHANAFYHEDTPLVDIPVEIRLEDI